MERGGFEPPKLAQQIYSLTPLATREPLQKERHILLAESCPVNRFSWCFLEESRGYDEHLARKIWSWREELNPRPAAYKAAALPTELRQQILMPTQNYPCFTGDSPAKKATCKKGGAILGDVRRGSNLNNTGYGLRRQWQRRSCCCSLGKSP